MGGIGQGYQPIVGFGTLPPSVKARWGAEWKKASVYWYDRVGGVNFSGEHIAYRDNYMDLDPTYKDHLGDPLVRISQPVARARSRVLTTRTGWRHRRSSGVP